MKFCFNNVGGDLFLVVFLWLVLIGLVDEFCVGVGVSYYG